MKIVIVGGGKVGTTLCAELASEHNDVMLIEKNPKTLEKLINHFDVSGVPGNGASIDIQREAGVETADIFIAVTEMDEINIMACVLAKKLGATYTVARVRNPEYSMQLRDLKESLGVNLLINPEMSAARDIVRVLKYPSALSVETFAGERVSLVEFEIDAASPLKDLSLKDFRNRFGSVIVCIINRGEEIIIPSGENSIQENDRIFVTGSVKDMAHFFKIVEKSEKAIRSTFIVGGGRIAYYLLKALQPTRISATVVEVNEERAEFLSETFPDQEILHADGTNHDILDEQQVEEFDSFVSLTGVDEENLVMSVYAKHKGVKKVITKMSRTGIMKVLKDLPIKTIITPKQIVASEILQFIRSRANTQGSNVEALYRLADNQVEALQFCVKSGSRVCNIPLSQLQTKTNLLIAYIIRGTNLIFPGGNDMVQENDRVIVVTTNKHFEDLDDILEN